MFCCVKIKESFFRGTVSYQFFFEINQIILKNLNSKLNQKNQGFNPNRKEIKFQQKINFFSKVFRSRSDPINLPILVLN